MVRVWFEAKFNVLIVLLAVTLADKGPSILTFDVGAHRALAGSSLVS